MDYEKDGVTADKIFIDPILEDLGIEVSDDDLKMAFMEEKEKFFDVILEQYEGKTPYEALVAYIQSGKYLEECAEMNDGQPLETEARALEQLKSLPKLQDEINNIERGKNGKFKIADLVGVRTIAEVMANKSRGAIEAYAAQKEELSQNDDAR